MQKKLCLSFNYKIYNFKTSYHANGRYISSLQDTWCHSDILFPSIIHQLGSCCVCEWIFKTLQNKFSS